MKNICKSWIHPNIAAINFSEAGSKEVLLAYATGTKEEILTKVTASGHKMVHPAYLLGYIKNNPEWVQCGTTCITTLHEENSFVNTKDGYGKCQLDFRNNAVQGTKSNTGDDYALCLLFGGNVIFGWYFLVEKAN